MLKEIFQDSKYSKMRYNWNVEYAQNTRLNNQRLLFNILHVEAIMLNLLSQVVQFV